MEVADGIFPNPYFHINGLSHIASYLQQVEMTGNYIMIQFLTTLASRLKL